MKSGTRSKRIRVSATVTALVLSLFAGTGAFAASADEPAPYSAEEHALAANDGNEAPPADPVRLQLLGITDFHGYLRALNDSSNGKINSPGGPIVVGGAAYNAAHLKRLKEGHDNSIVVSIGDNFSGWPFEVDAYKNEPTVEFLNAIGVEVSAAGNHEFDISADFLTKHMMNGKCFGTRGEDSCYEDSTGKPFHGSDFDYISANVRDARSGQLVLKPYFIKRIPDGRGGTIPVGFIGLTEAATFTKEQMSYQVGSLYADEAPPEGENLPADENARALLEPANRYAKELQEQGVETIVLLLHEGGSHRGYFNGCVNPFGPAVEFAKYASPAIDVILTGHWHASFNCMIDDPDGNPRPVMEGSNHGRLISEVNLSIDPVTKDVIRERTVAANHPVTRDIAPDPEVERIVSYWAERGGEKWAEPLAELTGDLTRVRNEHGESALADVIADAFYETARTGTPQPADFALTSGVPKRDLLYAKGTNPADKDGLLTFGEYAEANGTHSSEVVVTYTGEQIDRILEQQWTVKADGTEQFDPLNVSYNVRYAYDKSRPIGDRIDPERVLIDGKPLKPGKTYRVATSGTLLISGPAVYPEVAHYTNPVRIASWPVVEYLKKKKVIGVPELNRIVPAEPQP
ncbi:bifunctional metallophosphatase/5'-nucleotidase [Paenibacillus flagellatus]|nr:bifunctional metallophosphatase/5'-nucleotidase [Paenibacillus flagellatus]